MISLVKRLDSISEFCFHSFDFCSLILIFDGIANSGFDFNDSDDDGLLSS